MWKNGKCPLTPEEVGLMLRALVTVIEDICANPNPGVPPNIWRWKCVITKNLNHSVTIRLLVIGWR